MKIYTLGYEKRTIDQFIEALKAADVHTLIDVRETAWSYKRDFCKVKFSQALSGAGINYIHLRELGNPKRFRRDDSDRDRVLGKYKSHLEETEAGIPEIIDLIKVAKRDKKNICLTCYEREHTECHRSIITNHPKIARAATITHL